MTSRPETSAEASAEPERPAWVYASVSSLGLEMGISVAVGCGIGLWADKQFGTEPWLLLLFLGFGIAAGFKGMFRAAREAQRAANIGTDLDTTKGSTSV